MTTEPREVALAFLDLAAAGRVDEAIALLAPDCACWYTGAGDVSRADFTAGMRMLDGLGAGGTRFPIIDTVQEGDRVAVEYRGHMPLKNGRTYANTYHSKFVIKDGQITAIREYLDPLIVAAALGEDPSA